MAIPKANSIPTNNINSAVSNHNNGSSGSATINIPFNIEKPNIDEDTKNIMRRNNFDPENQVDVERYNNLPESEKTRMAEEYFNSLCNTAVTANPNPKKSDKSDGKHPAHSIELPDNWADMSISEKEDFINNTIGRKIYGEEKWNKLDNTKKLEFRREHFERIARKINPNYDKLPPEQKHQIIKRIAGVYAVVLSKIEGGTYNRDIFKQELDKFLSLPEEEQEQAIQDCSLIKQQEKRIALNENIMKVLGLPEDTEITNNHRVQYYKKLEESGIKLNKVQLIDKRTSEALVKLGKGDVSSSNGTVTLETLLSESGITLEKGRDGNFDPSNINNIKKISSYVKNFKDYDNFETFICLLSTDEQRAVLTMIQRKDSELTKEDFDRLELRKLGLEFVATNMVIGKDSSEASQMVTAEAHSDAFKNGDLSDDGNKYYYQQTSQYYTTQAQIYEGQITAELNDKNSMQYYNEYTAERDDYEEVFKSVSEYINNSDTVTDETKSFYTQNYQKAVANANSNTNTRAITNNNNIAANNNNIQTTNNIGSTLQTPADNMEPDKSNSSTKNTKDIDSSFSKDDLKEEFIKANPEAAIKYIKKAGLNPKDYLKFFAKSGFRYFKKVTEELHMDPRAIATYFKDNPSPEAVGIAIQDCNKELAEHMKNNPSTYGLFENSSDYIKILMVSGTGINEILKEGKTNEKELDAYSDEDKKDIVNIAIETKDKNSAKQIIMIPNVFNLPLGSEEWENLNKIAAQDRTSIDPNEFGKPPREITRA